MSYETKNITFSHSTYERENTFYSLDDVKLKQGDHTYKYVRFIVNIHYISCWYGAQQCVTLSFKVHIHCNNWYMRPRLMFALTIK